MRARVSGSELLRPRVVVTALALLVAASVTQFVGPHWTLESGYTDHLRHEYSAWAFLHIGIRVWDAPLADWHVHARHVHAFWRPLPEFYPPGLLLIFLPFGVASNTGLLSDPHVHLLEVMFLSGAAVVASYQLLRTLRLFYDPALALLLGATGAFLFVSWAMDGFVDALVAGTALLGIYWAERGNPGRGLVTLSIALSIHFRLWYLWPAALAIAAHDWRRIRRWQLAVSAGLGLASLAAFLLAVPAVGKLGKIPHSDPNYLALSHGLNGERVVALLGGVALLLAVYLSERRLTPTACVALALCFVFGVNQWEAWYTILLFPLFAVLRSRVAQGAVTLAILQVALVLGGGFPNMIRGIHLYYDALRH